MITDSLPIFIKIENIFGGIQIFQTLDGGTYNVDNA